MFNLKEIEEITWTKLFLFSLYAYTVVTTNIDLEKPKRKLTKIRKFGALDKLELFIYRISFLVSVEIIFKSSLLTIVYLCTLSKYN